MKYKKAENLKVFPWMADMILGVITSPNPATSEEEETPRASTKMMKFTILLLFALLAFSSSHGEADGRLFRSFQGRDLFVGDIEAELLLGLGEGDPDPSPAGQSRR